MPSADAIAAPAPSRPAPGLGPALLIGFMLLSDRKSVV